MTRPRFTRTVRGDDGYAPLNLLLGVALLVIPVLFLVLTIPTWIDRTVDARDAASDAARALATASSWAAGEAAADQSIAQVATNDGLTPEQIHATYLGSLAAGGTVTATVTITIPAGVVPGIGSYGTMHYTASNTQHIDTYRANNA